MNLYIIVEGIGDKIIYENWIPFLNNELKVISNINDFTNNNFYIISGNGYPNYIEVIKDAIETVNVINNIDRLIISVDSEDFTRHEKLDEIQQYVFEKTCNIPIHIVVQHFCIETWLLANSKIGPRNPKGSLLKEFKTYFDVLSNDPELLPEHPKYEYNRAQFAYIYLKNMLKDKGKNVTYIKGNPKYVTNVKYFNEIQKRHEHFSHIASFQDFVTAIT